MMTEGCKVQGWRLALTLIRGVSVPSRALACPTRIRQPTVFHIRARFGHAKPAYVFADLPTTATPQVMQSGTGGGVRAPLHHADALNSRFLSTPAWRKPVGIM